MEDDELPSSLSAELAAIGGAVRFRQADDLEEEVSTDVAFHLYNRLCIQIREQFSHEFGKEEEASCSSQIRRDVNPISDLLRVDKSVKHGDLTPLELLQAQVS